MHRVANEYERSLTENGRERLACTLKLVTTVQKVHVLLYFCFDQDISEADWSEWDYDIMYCSWKPQVHVRYHKIQTSAFRRK